MKSLVTAAVVGLLFSFGQTFAADPDNPNASKLDKEAPANAVRASTMNGMDVYNLEGKNIGEIHDVVIDTSTGKVRYAALSFGGFLGVGDKLFAIPWHALQTKLGDDNEYHLYLNIDKPTLDNAPGFNKDAWPSFADQDFSTKVDTYYRERFPERRTNINRRDGADVDVNAPGVRVKANVNRQPQR